MENPMQHTTPADTAAYHRDSYNVRLPVLPWVRKVMIAEFGPEPIRIAGHTLLGKHMKALPFDLPEKNERPDLDTAGSAVLVNVSALLWASVRDYNQLFQAGYYFEKLFQRMMVSHVRAQARLDVPNMTAIRDWLDMYGLDIDDDYSLEAAYELWKVYKQGQAKRESQAVKSPGIFPQNHRGR
jgi:hypothetical protein